MLARSARLRNDFALELPILVSPPQQHPARDAQDTFFIKDPVKADRPRQPAAKDGETQHSDEAYKKYWDDVQAARQTVSARNLLQSSKRIGLLHGTPPGYGRPNETRQRLVRASASGIVSAERLALTIRLLPAGRRPYYGRLVVR